MIINSILSIYSYTRTLPYIVGRSQDEHVVQDSGRGVRILQRPGRQRRQHRQDRERRKAEMQHQQRAYSQKSRTQFARYSTSGRFRSQLHQGLSTDAYTSTKRQGSVVGFQPSKAQATDGSTGGGQGHETSRRDSPAGDGHDEGDHPEDPQHRRARHSHHQGHRRPLSQILRRGGSDRRASRSTSRP